MLIDYLGYSPDGIRLLNYLREQVLRVQVPVFGKLSQHFDRKHGYVGVWMLNDED